MKKSELIMTSTAKMTREEWLNFRKPMTHVMNFILDYRTRFGAKDLTVIFSSPEWQSFHFPCIGGSEIATIMGLNPYKAKIEIFLEKVGQKPTNDEDNIAMFWGRKLEEEIAEMWQYWDGSPEGQIMNYNSQNLIRKCRKINFYVQHRESPWIFVSLDRVINKQETVDEGALECKTISGFTSRMWDSGIPPMYIVQLQTQLGTTALAYGELALLKDGRYFDVIPFDRHQALIDRCVAEAKKFHDDVKKGIEWFILSQVAVTEAERDLCLSEIQKLEPEPDGSDAYKQYLSDTYNQSMADGLIGTEEHKELARQYKYYGNRVGDLEGLQQEASNRLKAFMGNSSKLDLGDLGKVTWNTNAKGTRTFLVNIKLPAGYHPENWEPEKSVEEKILDHNKVERKKKKPKHLDEPEG